MAEGAKPFARLLALPGDAGPWTACPVEWLAKLSSEREGLAAMVEI